MLNLCQVDNDNLTVKTFHEKDKVYSTDKLIDFFALKVNTNKNQEVFLKSQFSCEHNCLENLK